MTGQQNLLIPEFQKRSWRLQGILQKPRPGKTHHFSHSPCLTVYRPLRIMLDISERIERHDLFNELVITTESRGVQPVIKISLRL